jgi:hypothetical protein
MARNARIEAHSGRVKTLAEAAKVAHCSVSTVKKAIRAGFVQRQADGSFKVEGLLVGIAAQGSRKGGRPVAGSGGTGELPRRLLGIKVALAKEDLKFARIRTKQAERAEAVNVRNLVDRSAVVREYSALLIEFRDALMGVLPQRVNLRYGKEVALFVQQEVRELLTALSEGAAHVNHTETKQGEPDEGLDRICDQDASARVNRRRPRGSHSTTSSQPSRTH